MALPIWPPKFDAFPKKNILTPIGALSFGIFSAAIAGAVAIWPSELSWALFAVALVPLAVAIWAYIYFAINDPDRLQTEDYRIQSEYVSRLPATIDVAPGHLAPRDTDLVPRIGRETSDE